MASTDPKAVADKFFKAWTTGDFVTARGLLHDDLSFDGPLDKFDNADAYVAALTGLAQIVESTEEQKVFVDDNDVCVIYNLVTNTPAGAALTAEWYHLRDAKISAVRVIFDARPFAAMFEGRAGH